MRRKRILPFYRAYYRYGVDDEIVDDDIEVILTKGRKAIATIKNIEYLGVDRETTESFTIQDKTYFWADDKPTYCTSFYTSSYPMVKLTYVFNPPDDASEQDLSHHIIVPFDSSKKLRPGDMLPILYYISPENNADVMSMPFPLPLKQIRKYGEIYYHHGTTDVIPQ